MLVSSVPLSETHIAGRPRSAMMAEVVDDGEDPKPSAIGQHVADEVQRPALVGSLRNES
jgi:hypothetical protein